jgi:PAS domain S-box-containing protein
VRDHPIAPAGSSDEKVIKDRRRTPDIILRSLAAEVSWMMMQREDPSAGAALWAATVPVGRMLLSGSAVIYAIFALAYVIIAPTEPHLPLALVFTVVGALFAVVAWLLPHTRPAALEPLLLGSAFVAEAGAIAFVPITADPKQSVAVIIVLVAAGAVLPTLRSSILAMLFGVLGWLATATWFPSSDFVHWLVNVGAAGVVGVTITAVRLRAVADLRLTRFMTDRAHDAIYLLTHDQRVRYANDAASRMLGYAPDELSRLLATQVDPSITPESWERIWGAMRRRGSVVLPTNHRRKDGTLVPVELSLTLAELDGREYACAIGRDVTERRAVERTLERARHAAEAASRAKTDFLATMSHEIRTPLNGIFGMTELALETTDDLERREFIRGARASAEVLLAMLNDILDHSQLEAGRLAIENVEFDLHDLCRRIMASLSADAQRRGIALKLTYDPALPERMLGDPRRLRQVLTNLAFNALKFTERGEVELRLDLEPSASHDGRPRVRIAVRDTGIGIAAGDLEKVFEPFTQVDSSSSRRYGGVGLGLAITRDLVHAMSGTIEASSTPGVGSTFTCRLPLTPATTHDSTSSAQL